MPEDRRGWRGDDQARETPRLAFLAETVRQRRRDLGLRQAEVADLAGCSVRFVHTVEHGKTSLRLDKVLDVLAVLGLGLVVVRDRKPKRPHGLKGEVGRGIRPDKEGVAEGQAAPIPLRTWLRTCRDGRARRGERGPRGDHGQTGRPDAWMGVWRRTGGLAGAPGR